MYKVVPFMHHPLPHIEQKPQTRLEVKLPPVPPTATYWTYPITSHASRDKQPTHKTYIMATLNATPDSFSLPDTLSYAALAFAAGANIVDIGDIGGYSTVHLDLDENPEHGAKLGKPATGVFWGEMRLDVKPGMERRIRGGYAGFRNLVRFSSSRSSEVVTRILT